MVMKIECSIDSIRKQGAKLIDRVRYSDGRIRLVVTKHGEPAVALISLDDLAALEACTKAANRAKRTNRPKV